MTTCNSVKILGIYANNKKHIEVISYEQYLSLRDSLKFYKKMNERFNKYCFLFCGKCEWCKIKKRFNITKYIDNQYLLSKYSYLLTLTFKNNNIDILKSEQDRTKIHVSQYSTLSKVRIRNIIRDLKTKLNKHYGFKVPLHFFCCGEYGSTTARAHYHCLLFLDVPLPNLKPEPVKGEHYKCKLLNKLCNIGHYDLVPMSSETAQKTSKYLTKYLTKQFNNKHSVNLNRFQDYQLKYYVINNIDLNSVILFKSWNDVVKLIFINEFKKWELIDKVKFNYPNFQSEFFIKSRRLGMFNDDLKNAEQGLINREYKSRLKRKRDQLLLLDFKNNNNNNQQQIQHINNVLNKLHLNNNLKMAEWFAKQPNNILNYDKYKTKNDIF